MTLSDFRKIIQRVGFIQSQYEQNPPNAVCMSRAIFTNICNEISKQSVKAIDPEDVTKARLFGLSIFVDDDMPNEYYQIGYAHEFEDVLALRKKIRELSNKIDNKIDPIIPYVKLK